MARNGITPPHSHDHRPVAAQRTRPSRLATKPSGPRSPTFEAEPAIIVHPDHKHALECSNRKGASWKLSEAKRKGQGSEPGPPVYREISQLRGVRVK